MLPKKVALGEEVAVLDKFEAIRLLSRNARKNIELSSRILSMAEQLVEIARMSSDRKLSQDLFSYSKDLASIGKGMLQEAEDTQSQVSRAL